MRFDCLRIAELNLKINDFSKSNIINFSPERQKYLEQERERVRVMLNMKYTKLNTDLVLAKVNTQGIKMTTDIKEIGQIIEESQTKK